MAPMFGKHHEDDDGGGGSPPRLCDLGPALDAAVAQAQATALPALAARLMSELFGSEYAPRGNRVDVDSLASPLIPDHSPAKAGDPHPDGARILWDLAAEAVQLLEQARLVMPDLWYSGSVACFGYHSTRAGRSAVEQGTVEQLVAAVTA